MFYRMLETVVRDQIEEDRLFDLYYDLLDGQTFDEQEFENFENFARLNWSLQTPYPEGGA
jgi:hypothetical protein